MAVLAPIPRAIVPTAIAVTSRFFARSRAPKMEVAPDGFDRGFPAGVAPAVLDGVEASHLDARRPAGFLAVMPAPSLAFGGHFEKRVELLVELRLLPPLPDIGSPGRR